MIFLLSFTLGILGTSLGIFQLGYSIGRERHHRHEND